jgi:hypothetical protein
MPNRAHLLNFRLDALSLRRFNTRPSGIPSGFPGFFWPFNQPPDALLMAG